MRLVREVLETKEKQMSDVVVRAKAALEGVTGGPWETIYHQHDTSYPSDTYHVITERTGDLVAEVDDESRGYEEPHGEFGRDAAFVAAARSLVPELVAEVERLRSLQGATAEDFPIYVPGEGELMMARAAIVSIVDSIERGHMKWSNQVLNEIAKSVVVAMRWRPAREVLETKEKQ